MAGELNNRAGADSEELLDSFRQRLDVDPDVTDALMRVQMPVAGPDTLKYDPAGGWDDAPELVAQLGPDAYGLAAEPDEEPLETTQFPGLVSPENEG